MLDNICLQILLELLGKMFLGAFEEPAVIAATIWIEVPPPVQRQCAASHGLVPLLRINNLGSAELIQAIAASSKKWPDGQLGLSVDVVPLCVLHV